MVVHEVLNPVAHLLLVLFGRIQAQHQGGDVAQDIAEEGHPGNHDAAGVEHLRDGCRNDIAVPHSGQGGDGPVNGAHQAHARVGGPRVAAQHQPACRGPPHTQGHDHRKQQQAASRGGQGVDPGQQRRQPTEVEQRQDLARPQPPVRAGLDVQDSPQRQCDGQVAHQPQPAAPSRAPPEGKRGAGTGKHQEGHIHRQGEDAVVADRTVADHKG